MIVGVFNNTNFHKKFKDNIMKDLFKIVTVLSLVFLVGCGGSSLHLSLDEAPPSNQSIVIGKTTPAAPRLAERM